jgi:phage/plasmid-like protein (TIGR03299 family)
MAHNIDMSNGRANIAFTGETPWHELGVEMPANADLAEWRKQAGLNFVAKAATVEFAAVGGEDQPCPTVTRHRFDSKVVLYRGDTNAPLGVVSAKNYKVVQPGEVIDFFANFAKAGDMKLEVAGSILGGRRIWALARLDKEIRIKGQDVVRPFFNLTTSFDGETATIGTFTSVRVVCNNTLNMLYQEVDADGVRKGFGRSGFYIPHSSKFDASAAQRHVADLVVAATQFEEDANVMADRFLTGDEALKFFVGLVGVEDEKGKDLTRQSRAKVERLMSLYQSGPGAGYRSSNNTVWGALNAVTRFVDFDAKQRAAGGRLISAWYGAGKELKSKAFKTALSVAKGEEVAEAA